MGGIGAQNAAQTLRGRNLTAGCLRDSRLFLASEILPRGRGSLADANLSWQRVQGLNERAEIVDQFGVVGPAGLILFVRGAQPEAGALGLNALPEIRCLFILARVK